MGKVGKVSYWLAKFIFSNDLCFRLNDRFYIYLPCTIKESVKLNVKED